MLGFFLFVLFIIVASVVIAKLVFWVATRAIIFARGVVALCVALLLSHYGTALVPNHGFLNFIVWALICLGVVFLLSFLPRVDLSTRFSCTLAISSIVMELVVGLLSGLLIESFEMTIVYEIITKVVCLGISLFVIFSQECNISPGSPSWFPVRIFDRLLASILYGISFVIVCLSTHSNWELASNVQFIVLIIGVVGTFVADILLFPQIAAKTQVRVEETIEESKIHTEEVVAKVLPQNEGVALEDGYQNEATVLNTQPQTRKIDRTNKTQDKNGLIAGISRLAKQKDRYTYVPSISDVSYEEYLKARSADKNRCATCSEKIGYRSILGYQHAYYHKGAYYCFLCYEKEEYAEQMSTLKGRIEYYLTPDDDWD